MRNLVRISLVLAASGHVGVNAAAGTLTDNISQVFGEVQRVGGPLLESAASGAASMAGAAMEKGTAIMNEWGSRPADLRKLLNKISPLLENLSGVRAAGQTQKALEDLLITYTEFKDAETNGFRTWRLEGKLKRQAMTANSRLRDLIKNPRISTDYTRELVKHQAAYDTFVQTHILSEDDEDSDMLQGALTVSPGEAISTLANLFMGDDDDEEYGEVVTSASSSSSHSFPVQITGTTGTSRTITVDPQSLGVTLMREAGFEDFLIEMRSLENDPLLKKHIKNLNSLSDEFQYVLSSTATRAVTSATNIVSSFSDSLGTIAKDKDVNRAIVDVVSTVSDKIINPEGSDDLGQSLSNIFGNLQSSLTNKPDINEKFDQLSRNVQNFADETSAASMKAERIGQKMLGELKSMQTKVMKKEDRAYGRLKQSITHVSSNFEQALGALSQFVNEMDPNQAGTFSFRSNTPARGQNQEKEVTGGRKKGKMIGMKPPAWLNDQSVEAPAGVEDMGSWQRRYYTVEQQGRLGVDRSGQQQQSPQNKGTLGLVGPVWTYDAEMERPEGIKNEGSYQRSVYTPEQQQRLSVTEDGRTQSKGTLGLVGPAWTYDMEMERPEGIKNEGSYQRRVYTPEQQQRLSVTEDGRNNNIGSVGPAWAHSSEAEMPEGVKDEGSYQRRVYTLEQQERLGVDENGEPVDVTSRDFRFKSLDKDQRNDVFYFGSEGEQDAEIVHMMQSSSPNAFAQLAPYQTGPGVMFVGVVVFVLFIAMRGQGFKYERI